MLKNLFRRGVPSSHAYALDDVVETAASGRRLAIYDRATGLYAYWYLDLRADEEIKRARRYAKPVCLLSFWAADADMIATFGRYLHARLRDHDLAGYLNNGHFVVILPETSTDGAEIVFRRALEQFPTVEGAVAAYPDDGSSFDELLATAKRGDTNMGSARSA